MYYFGGSYFEKKMIHESLPQLQWENTRTSMVAAWKASFHKKAPRLTAHICFLIPCLLESRVGAALPPGQLLSIGLNCWPSLLIPGFCCSSQHRQLPLPSFPSPRRSHPSSSAPLDFGNTRWWCPWDVQHSSILVKNTPHMWLWACKIIRAEKFLLPAVLTVPCLRLDMQVAIIALQSPLPSTVVST